MSYLIGVDIGTTNWKAAAFDTSGNLVALKKTPCIITYDEKNQGYIDPNILWSHVSKILTELVAEIGADNVLAISSTSMGEAIVPVNKVGKATFPIIAWFDARPASQAARIKKEMGVERIFEITGLDCHPIFSLSKILWIREHDRKAYDDAQKWLQMADFINFRLSGESATDYSMASRTLLFDIGKCDWSDEILNKFSIDRSVLPPLVKAGTLLGAVTKKAAAETGLKEGTPVVQGGHDHPCATLACGVLLGRKLLDSSGTAESVLGVCDENAKQPKVFEGIRINRHLEPKRLVTWGGLISSGVSVDWIINQIASMSAWGVELPEMPYSSIMEKAAKVSPGSRGIMFMPHLRGAGAPFWNPLSRGALIGLRSTHTQPEIMRAVLEGLSFDFKRVIECTEKVSGITYDSITTVGGGSRISLWQDIKASMVKKPVVVPEVTEATPLGAALLAGIGVKVYSDMIDASKSVFKIKQVHYPDAKLSQTYDELFEIYKGIYPALVDINTKIENYFQ